MPQCILLMMRHDVGLSYQWGCAGGATVGALASAAMAWRPTDYGYYQRLMAAAAQVYATSLRSIARYASAFLYLCSAHINSALCNAKTTVV